MRRKILSVLCVIGLVLGMAWPGSVASAASAPEWSSVGSDPEANRVICLAESNGQLYKGTYAAGVLVWDGTAWAQVGAGTWPIDDSINYLADVAGTLYAGTFLHGVLKLDGGAWTQVGTSWPPYSWVYSLATDDEGTLYAGSSGGVWALEDGIWTQLNNDNTWPIADGPTSGPDSAYGLVNAGGTLYAQTIFSGVYALDSDGKWRTAGTGLPDSTPISSITADADGKLYAGTHDDVWVLGSDNVWTRLGEASQFTDNVQLTYVSETLYAWNQYGLWSWNGTGWTQASLPCSPSASTGYSLISWDGTLTCGVGDYVYRLDGSTWQEIGSYNGLPYSNLNPVSLPVADAGGTLYAGTYGGVWVFGGGAWTQVGADTWPKVNGFADRACSLLTDGQTVYAGTELSGVWQLSGGAWTSIGNSWPSGQGAWCLTFFDNTLYAGTYKWDSYYPSGDGVWALNDGTWTSVGDIIDGTWITSLASVDGKLYASTQTSVVYVFENGEWTSLDSYPYPSAANCLANVDGTLYAGTSGALSTDKCVIWAWDGASWTEKAIDDSLSINCLQKIDGTLYAGTNRGAFTVDGDGNLTQIGSDSNIYSFVKISGILYAGSDCSVMAYEQPQNQGDWVANGNPTAPDMSVNNGSTEALAIGITSPSELAWVAQQVNSGNDNFSGKYIKLMNDLDLSAHNWVPIGALHHSFNGSFDGGGHTVTGMTVDNEAYQYAGLFGALDNEGAPGDSYCVRNLNIGSGSSVTASYDDGSFAGGIAGYLRSGVISGCSNAGTIESTDGYAGGIVGSADFSSAHIETCRNTGDVTGNDAEAGGITGSISGDGFMIENCYNTGNISSTGEDGYAGGIVGSQFDAGKTQNCYNTGAIRTDGEHAYAGGIAGQQYSYIGTVLFSYCYNTGTVGAEGETAYAGGIVGISRSEDNGAAAVRHCAALGETVSATGSEEASACRIGYSTGSLSDNDALSVMRVTLSGTDKQITSNSGGADGANLDASSLMGSWWTGKGWDTDVWTLPGQNAYGLPVLKNAGGTQNTALPAYAAKAPIITTTALPGGTVGMQYSQTLQALGSAPITWSVTEGTLPGGLALTGNTISGTPTASGTFSFTIRAENGAGSITQALSIAIAAGGGGGSVTPVTPPSTNYSADITGGSAGGTKVQVSVDLKTNAATLDVSALKSSLITSGNSAVITVPSIPNVTSYTLGVRADQLSVSGGTGSLTMNTANGSVTVSSDMLAGTTGAAGKKAEITIGQGDKPTLPDDVKAAVGDRPLVSLSLAIDGKQTDWSNPSAPVTVTIPYTPTAAELANPGSIVIWYIDGSGKAVCVPNGHYDPATGKVTFTTTHFSDYAVGFNQVGFNDVKTGDWCYEPVTFIAARGITSGTGGGNFSPDAALTRGEFIVMLMKAYAIAPDNNPADNFADAGSTYYTNYLAAAKRLGISSGIGNSLFAPDRQITRQEMFTLLYNALKTIKQLPQGKSDKTLSDFADAGQAESWAAEAITQLVQTGTIGGSGGKLLPTGMTTRAEMAQLLYNLLLK